MIDSGSSCQCPEGFSGKHCENLDLLKIDTTLLCSNAGVVGESHAFKNLFCFCNPGFSGYWCEEGENEMIEEEEEETELQPCFLGHSCLNGGDCVENPNVPGSMECRCNGHWAGLTCEIRTEPRPNTEKRFRHKLISIEP